MPSEDDYARRLRLTIRRVSHSSSVIVARHRPPFPVSSVFIELLTEPLLLLRRASYEDVSTTVLKSAWNACSQCVGCDIGPVEYYRGIGPRWPAVTSTHAPSEWGWRPPDSGNSAPRRPLGWSLGSSLPGQRTAAPSSSPCPLYRHPRVQEGSR